MTDEPKGITDDWIEEHAATYAYAFDKGGALQRQLGVAGIPHAVLVDPTGTIVWEGHPAVLNGRVLEPLLVGAFPKPMFEWPASAAKVKKAILAGALGKALEEAKALPDGDEKASIVTSLEKMIEGKVKALEQRLEKGDFLGIENEGEGLQKSLAGLTDTLTRVDAVLKKAAEHPDAKRVIAGQREVRKIQAGKLRSKNDIKKAIEKLQDLESKYEGTYAATEARALRVQLVQRLNG